MSAGTEQRKLTTIMFSDMWVSALSQRNEAFALELFEEHAPTSGFMKGFPG